MARVPQSQPQQHLSPLSPSVRLYMLKLPGEQRKAVAVQLQPTQTQTQLTNPIPPMASPIPRFSSSITTTTLLTIAFLLLLASSLRNANASYYPYPNPNDMNMRYQFLSQQNAARASMGLPPLTWDDRVASYARRYAEQRRGDCALVHSRGPYGENLFWGSGDGGWSPAQAVSAWLSERPRYDYWSNSCYGGMCGHYTQIMWRSTRRVGCAVVSCYGGRGTFITCNYDPPGNYVGVRPY